MKRFHQLGVVLALMWALMVVFWGLFGFETALIYGVFLNLMLTSFILYRLSED